jgi:hypothetical protein
MNYRKPLTITFATEEEDDGFFTGANDKADNEVVFDEPALKPVPDEFLSFSEKTLRQVSDSVTKVVSDYHDLRRLGDIHRMTEDVAAAKGLNFKAAWDEARSRVAAIKEGHDKAQSDLDAVEKEWKAVKPLLGTHRITAESAEVEKSKVKVELIPHSSPTIAAVEAMIKRLYEALNVVNNGL